MFQLLYVSSACGEISDETLSSILEKARRNNSRDGITGVLLFIDGNFLQVLEGEQKAVEATFSRISRDERHKGITPLLKRQIPERCFAEWSMGFDRLNGRESAENQHIFRISSDAIKGRLQCDAPREVMMFLKTFLNINPAAPWADA